MIFSSSAPNIYPSSREQADDPLYSLHPDDRSKAYRRLVANFVHIITTGTVDDAADLGPDGGHGAHPARLGG
jgi:hypothetical protein